MVLVHSGWRRVLLFLSDESSVNALIFRLFTFALVLVRALWHSPFNQRSRENLRSNQIFKQPKNCLLIRLMCWCERANVRCVFFTFMHTANTIKHPKNCQKNGIQCRWVRGQITNYNWWHTIMLSPFSTVLFSNRKKNKYYGVYFILEGREFAGAEWKKENKKCVRNFSSWDDPWQWCDLSISFSFSPSPSVFVCLSFFVFVRQKAWWHTKKNVEIFSLRWSFVSKALLRLRKQQRAAATWNEIYWCWGHDFNVQNFVTHTQTNTQAHKEILTHKIR